MIRVGVISSPPLTITTDDMYSEGYTRRDGLLIKLWEEIARRENISRDTISRMASFKRHQQHKDVPYSEGCGGLMWDAWGGSAGVNWAISKLKQIDKK